MFRSRRRAIAIALLMVLPLVLAACSNTGGKKAAQRPKRKRWRCSA